MKLYEIDKELRALLESMDDHIDEETGELDSRFFDKVDGLTYDAKLKIEGIGVVCKELQGEAEMLKAEYNRLKARKEAAEKRRVWLTDYVTDMMDSMNIEKHKSPNGLFTVYMQKNPDKVVVAYPDNLPMKYQRITPVEANLRDLGADLKAGVVTGSVIDKAGIQTMPGAKKVRYK